MTVKVTKNGIPKDVFKQVRKEFTKANSSKAIKKAILDDMSKGVSPVRGERWKKYSDSYKSVIRGQARFRSYKDSDTGKQVVKASRQRDTNFFLLAALGGGKSLSPVNLKLTGELYKSLSVKTTGRLIEVAFKDFIALVHNKLGVRTGKGFTGPKILRRLLPTEGGERFNEGITQVVENLVKKAVDTVVKRINRQ